MKGANIVNQMAIATPNQINLRVKVAEVSRNALKVLGMNLTRTTGANFLIDTNNPITETGNSARNMFGALFRLPGNPNRILATLDLAFGSWKPEKCSKVIPISRTTQRIAVSVDDRWVFTADQTKPQLAVIDTASNEVKHWIATSRHRVRHRTHA